MKAILQILATCLIVVFNLNEAKAQDSLAEDSTSTTESFPPEFPGGSVALDKYLIESLNYPLFDKEKSRPGVAYVRFLIDTSGVVRNVSIQKGKEELATDLMKREAVRVVSEMPIWKPGVMNGKKQACIYVIPIHFKFR